MADIIKFSIENGKGLALMTTLTTLSYKYYKGGKLEIRKKKIRNNFF
jgi:hypothetical protein